MVLAESQIENSDVLVELVVFPLSDDDASAPSCGGVVCRTTEAALLNVTRRGDDRVGDRSYNVP